MTQEHSLRMRISVIFAGEVVLVSGFAGASSSSHAMISDQDPIRGR